MRHLVTILQFCPAPDYVSGRVRTQRPSWFGPRRAGVQTGVHTQTYAEICTEDPRKILALLNYFCAEWIGRSTLRNSAWACNVQPTAQFLTECHLSAAGAWAGIDKRCVMTRKATHKRNTVSHSVFQRGAT